jgi:hypothetical protein
MVYALCSMRMLLSCTYLLYYHLDWMQKHSNNLNAPSAVIWECGQWQAWPTVAWGGCEWE